MMQDVEHDAAAVTSAGSKPHRLVKRLQRTLVALIVALCLGGVFSSPTSADVGGGGNDGPSVGASGPPTGTYLSVTCESYYSGGNGTIRIVPLVTAQAGYYNGQYVTYRYHVANSNGYSAYSGWAGNTLVSYANNTVTYPWQMLPMALMAGGHGVTWRVSVQVARWTSAGWQYSWHTPWAYDHGGLGGAIYSNCTT